MTNILGETITFSDFADFGRGILTVNPDGDGLSSYPEFISFTGISSTTFTGCVRGLSGRTDTPSSSLIRFHPVNTPVVISFGAHNIQDLTDYVDDADGALVVGTGNVTVATAGETITAGQLVYLNTADGRWWKTDADTASTVQGVQLGIAQGAGTAGNSITNGVLLRGRDTNQSGLVAGTTYYASNTAGGIASSAGTTPRVIGVAISTTAINFDPSFSYTLTDDQQDAMAGSPGSPSSLNKFVTQNKTLLAGATINGATTPVPVYQNKTDNEFYACDANDTGALKFIGFAVSNGTDGAALRVQFNGIVSGFTGLAEGEKYYVQDAVGTIGTSPGTKEVLVGIAISETELLIQKGRHFDHGEIATLGTASSSSAITLGFRPSVIRIYASAGSSSHMSWVTISWVNGVTKAVNVHYNEGTDGQNGNEANLYDTLIGNYMTIAVNTVTDTGFTIAWTENATFAGGSSLMWEAEGNL